MDYIIKAKIGKRRIKAVRPKIVLEVLDRLEQLQRRKRRSWRSRRFLIGFLFWTGLRASEAILVRRRDLNIATRILNAPTLKQRDEIYYVPISLYHVPDDELRFWEQYLAGKREDDYILDIRSRYGVWKAVRESFEVFGYKGIYPHMLRHAIAILLVQCDVKLNVLQRFLRHTDPKNTAIYYAIGAKDMHPQMEWAKYQLKQKLLRGELLL